jgi:glycosyltransferase involved in cell wall biosynthesis
LQKEGFAPTLVGRQKKDSLPLPSRTYTTTRLPLIFQKGKLFYLELNIRLFFFMLFKKVDIITANDLDTLLPCFIVAKLKAKRLVYDSHEYFTELPELAHRKIEKKIWEMLEKAIFPNLQHISTVSNSIAVEYQKKYGKKVKLVCNYPMYQEITFSKTKEKILLYQGAVNAGRGLELMIETMVFLPDYKLWIIGSGTLQNKINAKAENLPNVKVMGKIPFEELKSVTPKALVGLSLEEDLGLNYRYALPNKIFDYVQAGVPVICSDLPEMRALVEEYGIGKVLFDRKPEMLAKMILELYSNKMEYESLTSNCLAASKILTWENEEKTLLSLYH